MITKVKTRELSDQEKATILITKAEIYLKLITEHCGSAKKIYKTKRRLCQACGNFMTACGGVIKKAKGLLGV
jgi:hypothetical protein